ncbi:uncharacterized protein EDB91DRAFT_487521 [Suillus paluster]|uniref:uncharacterized protein n=1 Tax=Suillus paluster TaxID=48578 RepID=UPI001B883E3C|nr:uncharacterized protein EDB91DRAFT_487521 [Suillus paluster]KAG1737060.1 hypothetical protein EDB91DRAFT_487521 [Suillus paluster]
MDTTATDGALDLDASKRTDGCYSCHRIPRLERLHELALLGSVVLSKLHVAYTDANYGPAHSSACCWLSVHHVRCNSHCQIAFGRLCIGTLLKASAGILFALIDASATYWAFGFPSALLVVFGTDFAYSSGTLFTVKIALPHEQSVAGALFQTMTQVRVSIRSSA